MSEPWRCDVVGSFAWRTCAKRWPKIVRDLADDVTAHAADLHSLAAEIEGGVVGSLDRLEAGDRDRFDVVGAYVGRPWTSLPWYVGEAFLYARIRAVVGWSTAGIDPFRAAKGREEANLPDDDDDDDDLSQLLTSTVWGNRGDLSLPSARGFTHEHDHDLIVDERPAAVALLARASRVGIVLDNAGLELWRDLQLARFLVDSGKQVTLFAKDRPFFVSDALSADIARTRALLRRDLGAVEIVAHAFFTGPDFLLDALLPDDLRRLLGDDDVLLVKGDCNYRRLVGDVPFSAGARSSFNDAVQLSAPVIALRTLKAEVLVGADPDGCAAAAKQSPDWLVSGRFGVVQVALANNVVDSKANAP